MRPTAEVLRDRHDVRPALLELNAQSVVETSPLSVERFDWMIAAARVATYVPPADAFLIAFADTDDFDGGHFKWFGARCEGFLYIDRIVVAAHRRGFGIGRILYEDLFARARGFGIDRIACEVNLEPPNPRSQAFHEALGFKEVGRATIEGGDKTVRYLMRTIA